MRLPRFSAARSAQSSPTCTTPVGDSRVLCASAASSRRHCRRRPPEMQTQPAAAISLDELTNTLESYAGPARPRRLPVQRRWRPWRLAWAAAALVLVSVGADYA